MRGRIPWSRLLHALERTYGDEGRGWRTPVLRRRGGDPFVVLVSTVLSHRTRDEVTLRATRALLTAYPTPGALSRGAPRDVGRLIREVGFPRAKSQALIAASRVLVTRFHGRVPSSEKELLTIPRVGPKTAHAILVFGFEKPALPVDTHILRVTKRLGVVSPGASIPQAQRELARAVPRRYWHLLNPVLVQHGMNLCSSRSPKCVDCPIERWCRKVGVPRRPKRRPKG
jgi:endonuclease-3